MRALRAVCAVIAVLTLLASSVILTAHAGGLHAFDVNVVAEPRHGDVAVYERTVDAFRLPRDGGRDARPLLAFTWDGVHEVADARGDVWRMDRLVVVGDRVLEVRDYPGGALEPAVRASSAAYAPLGDLEAFAGVEAGLLRTRYRDPDQDVTRMRYNVGSFATVAALEDCVARAGWQGLAIPELEGRPLPDVCPGVGVDAPLRDTGRVSVDGVGASRFTASDGSSTVTLTFTSGLAYPLTMEVVLRPLNPRPAPDEEPPRVLLRLVGHTRGDGPPLLTESPLVTSAAAPHRGSRGLAGPDDTGAGVPFTVADALDTLASSSVPEAREHQAWMDAHPGAAAARVTWGPTSTAPDAPGGFLRLAFKDGAHGHEATVALRRACPPGIPSPCLTVEDARTFDARAPVLRDPAWPRHGLTVAGALHVLATRGHTDGSVTPLVDAHAARAGGPGGASPPLIIVRVPGPDGEWMRVNADTGHLVEHAWHTPVPFTAFPDGPPPRDVHHAHAPGGLDRLDDAARGAPAPAALAGAGVAALGLVLSWRPALAPAAAVAAHRGTRHDPAAHPQRAAILDALRERPLTVDEVDAAAGRGLAATRWHLAVLAAAGRVARDGDAYALTDAT